MSIVRMRKSMKSWGHYLMFIVAVVFIIGFIGLGLSGSRSQKSDVGTGLVAKVNGDKIDRKTYELHVQREIERLEDERGMGMLGPLEEAQLRAQIFDQTVEQMLLVQAAKRERVKVSRGETRRRIEEYVDQQVKQWREMLLAGMKGPKTDQAFETQLQRRQPGMTIRKLRSDLRKSLDVEQIREQLLIQKLGEKLKQMVKTDEASVRASFDEIRFKQITVGSQRRSMAQAEQRAKELAEKAAKGSDFSALARQYSEDQYKAAGGDRGYFLRRAYIEPDLADEVFKLKAGEVSKPITTTQGFVIAKVEAKRSALPPDFNEPKKKKAYMDAYAAQEAERVQAKFFDEVHKTAKIQVYDSELKAHTIIKDLFSAMALGSLVERKVKIESAIKEYRRALLAANDQPNAMARAYAQIAYLYTVLRSPALFSPTKEEDAKYRAEAKKVLEEALKWSESNDLRMMLADLQIEEGQFDKAVENLGVVYDNAFEDANVHSQLQAKYEKMKQGGYGKVDPLIARERQWLDDYKKRMQAEQPPQAPSGVPTGPIPQAPPPGG